MRVYVCKEVIYMKRIILLSVLAYEGIGGILGGILLIAGPDGHLMKIPVGILHGSFPDFFIPGIILTGMGILNIAAFVEVFRKGRNDWLLAGFALIGFAIWFTVEIAILRELHLLHIMWGLPVLLGIWTALPLIPMAKKLSLRSNVI
jgi:hypothetical protein